VTPQSARTWRVNSYSSGSVVVVVDDALGAGAVVVGGLVDGGVVGGGGMAGVVIATGGECDPSALRSILSGNLSATHRASTGVAPACTSSDWMRPRL
jgi:hypothetical protein